MPLKRQILVVEDNEINREMLMTILSDQYEVLEAENGQIALDTLLARKDTVALVLLDLMMPVMDGYTFLDRIKEYPDLSLIPVIVMTQNDKVQAEVAALAHGATDFVPKPYHPDVVRHRVANLIKLRENAAMVNQFKYDQLTGLYNKEYFCHRVREELQEHPEKEYSIVCSNIENFKLISDMMGTQESERLLKELADIAQRGVGDAGFCGRYGADRFLGFVQRDKEIEARDTYGENGLTDCSPMLKGMVIRWGVYEIHDRAMPVMKMCDRAVLAVNSIKGQYHRYYAVYNDSLRGKLLRERKLTASMETALAENQFVVYLQPKYSLQGEDVAGAEALVRWIHPELGFVSPGEFIPLFEKNGFIQRLDYFVWEQMCKLLRSWMDKGYQTVPISVNVSRADVYQDNLVNTFLCLTQQYGIHPQQLHIEITESAYTENSGRILQTVEELRRQGFVIEMDDFGSGYSSLNMLSQMKLDVLKLDMKFIQNEINKPQEESILDDVISMAHHVHLSVVAEGVETQEQVKRLREVGSDFVQGYYFAKPMPMADFECLLKEKASTPATSIPETAEEEPATWTILLIHEDEKYRAQVRKAFEGYYQVRETTDVEDALTYLRSKGRRTVSAVILSMTIADRGADLFLAAMRREPDFWRLPVMAILPNGGSAEKLPLVMETDDFICKCHPIFDLRWRVQRLIYVASLHQREGVLEQAANRDMLTGVLNRRGLQVALSALRKEDMPFAVCLFDLDRLKQINDTYGHDMGDRVLHSFADVLRSHTREADIQCRFGGDEFIVIFKRLNNEDTVVMKVTEISQAFAASWQREKIPASCSVGVALCGRSEMPSTMMIKRADQALYQAKRTQKGSCCVWSEGPGESEGRIIRII
ncbi:MAG: EAL domain-containing protein [Clostridiales bacterium]|nr:EAL domain-containing protein [Clostridiales bacterium]